MNNAFDPAAAEGLDERTRELVAARAERLGPAYRLFYDEPVHVVRGEGVRLWDPDGNEYLDAYNNVVSVGHAHPAVVAAVHAQMQTLCTHTRYLHDGIVRYAGELLETFGGELGAGHLMLTCTGSEANDLALRIARYRTGRNGVIITSEAYHGNSARTAEISPSLGENSPLGTWVRTVPAPDSYRRDDLPHGFAADVRAAIRDLERHGDGVAALIVDSAFSSDGIYTEPADLLGEAAAAVREAGGLFIADEVQSGFGRLGDSLWGYQRHGVDPDIATLGKPMGNGFPVAGVVVRHEVVADFGHDVRYFNTFGGNTVAVAAAQATFDVIRDEGLVENARAVGETLRAGLRELAASDERIGDVRGRGLYAGVELVSDRDAKTPDAALAAAVVNGLRRRRVLISATGPAGNVLKIRPPLVFGEADATRLLEALADTVAASSSSGAATSAPGSSSTATPATATCGSGSSASG
jgi:4-aminobutyrate aminotransferase-like enzyme